MYESLDSAMRLVHVFTSRLMRLNRELDPNHEKQQQKTNKKA